MSRSTELLILGLGNLLCSDDGLGVAAAARLEQDYLFGPGVRLLDGGTLGLSLLPHLQEAREAILLDAVLTGAPPGSLVRLEGSDVGPAARDRLSVHQIGVADLLDAAELLGELPERVTLLGVVPQSTALGVCLTAPVAAALPELVAEVVREVRGRGHPVHERGQAALGVAGSWPRSAAVVAALGAALPEGEARSPSAGSGQPRPSSLSSKVPESTNAGPSWARTLA